MKEARELFSRQMTRREFLQLLGVVILSVIGVTNFLASLRTHLGQSSGKSVGRNTGRGFGTSKFGV